MAPRTLFSSGATLRHAGNLPAFAPETRLTLCRPTFTQFRFYQQPFRPPNENYRFPDPSRQQPFSKPPNENYPLPDSSRQQPFSRPSSGNYPFPDSSRQQPVSRPPNGNYPLPDSSRQQPFRQPNSNHPLSRSSQQRRGPLGHNTPPKDEEINARAVQIAGDDGALGEPISLWEALESFDREQSFLVKVADPSADRATVCRIVSKADFREQQRAKLKTKTSKGADSTAGKQIELNWAIDQHDLSHRLKQMESFLNKGKKVQLLLMKKKRKRPATEAEAQILLETVQQRIKDIDATQVKPMRGKLLYQVEFTLEKAQNA